MEIALDKLKEEIEELKTENSRLENIYIINGLSKFAEEDEEEKLDEWHKDAQKSTFGEDVSDENSVPLNKTYLMAKTMGWTLDNCFSQTSLNESGQTNEWKTKWSNKIWDSTSINLEFSVENREATETKVDIKAIDASINDAYLPEVQPLVEKCIEVNELSKFFTQFESYLKFHNERSQHLQDSKEVQIDKTTGEHRITFKTHGDKEALARLHWQISYDPANDTFNTTYKVGLTDEGQTMVQKYNFPEELLTKGYVEDWDPNECRKNLQQMIDLESNGTPVKKSRK